MRLHYDTGVRPRASPRYIRWCVSARSWQVVDRRDSSLWRNINPWLALAYHHAGFRITQEY